MFGWIKGKLFICLIRGFLVYYIKQIDKILPLSVIDTQYDIIMCRKNKKVTHSPRRFVGQFFVLPTLCHTVYL
jgi:hypothetical protein